MDERRLYFRARLNSVEGWQALAQIYSNAANYLRDPKIRRQLAERKIPKELLDKERVEIIKSWKKAFGTRGTYLGSAWIAGKLGVWVGLNAIGGEKFATPEQLQTIETIKFLADSMGLIGVGSLLFSVSPNLFGEKGQKAEWWWITDSVKLLKPKNEEAIQANERKLGRAIEVLENMAKESARCSELSKKIHEEKIQRRRAKIKRFKDGKERFMNLFKRKIA